MLRKVHNVACSRVSLYTMIAIQGLLSVADQARMDKEIQKCHLHKTEANLESSSDEICRPLVSAFSQVSVTLVWMTFRGGS